jgi:hypothetical protein
LACVAPETSEIDHYQKKKERKKDRVRYGAIPSEGGEGGGDGNGAKNV